MTKREWITFFKDQADSILAKVNLIGGDQKSKAREINKRIKVCRDRQLEITKTTSVQNLWSNKKLLNEILLLTYASYVAMLEYRNKVWKYDYMTFSRRIGELWEPFCKLPFEYSVKHLTIIEPPDFDDVQDRIRTKVHEYIDSLFLDSAVKEELKRHYAIPWTMVDSGGTKLALDLHFEQNGIHYNCDFKSGFSSNEKGNTNRLLLVASIYHSLGETERTLLFVRQNEDENSHYLQTLKNSPYWNVYCANDSYAAMKDFTGFDLRLWLDNNVDWANDISAEFKEYLKRNDLLKYLTW